jgi:hypothetical protein
MFTVINFTWFVVVEWNGGKSSAEMTLTIGYANKRDVPAEHPMLTFKDIEAMERKQSESRGFPVLITNLIPIANARQG